jgi:hypothetical protein
VLAVVNAKSLDANPLTEGAMIGSYKLLQTSNSIVKGQYMSGKNFGCERIPDNKVNEKVFESFGKIKIQLVSNA